MCSKKGKMLCKFASEEQTRSFLFNHLVSSPYHSMEGAGDNSSNVAPVNVA